MYLVISLVVMALVVGAIVFLVKRNSAKSGPATVGGEPPKNPPTPTP
jgi:hypothetical protein